MNESLGQHWGEIPALPDMDSGIAAVERQEMITTQPLRIQSLKVDCLSTDDNNFEDNSIDFESLDVPIGDPVMLHTIKLLQFSRCLNDSTSRMNFSRESIPQIIKTNKNNSKELNVFTIKDRNLNQKAIKKLLRRAVIIIAVFSGFESTTKSVIDLLVDILSEYLSHLCQTFRSTTDSLELMSSKDFIDVIDRVFHDLNVPDFESLRQYDSDIKLYNRNLIKEVHKKIGFNESMNTSNKIQNNFQIDSNNDNLSQTTNSSSDSKGLESISLHSLLSSVKTNNTEETDHLFDLTSLTNKSGEN